MSDVLELRSFSGILTDEFGCQHCEFTAIVDDMVQTVPASRFGPAEFGAALCRGTLLLSGDETSVNPVEAMHYVDDWTPVDADDY